MSEEQKCRICGCTDNKACEGGCSWVEPDLCSACLIKEGTGELDEMDKSGRFEITLKLDCGAAFQLLSALQLAARHPDIPLGTLQTLLQVGRALQERLSVGPYSAVLCQIGWIAAAAVRSEATTERRIVLPG
jgi:hypothetical protein